jgi:pilus assembly protein CpaB
MIRRGTMLAAAAVIALVGVAAVFAYVNRVDKSSAHAASLRTALVASKTITAGTAGSDLMKRHLYVEERLPGQAVPSGAVTDARSLSDLVTTTDIYPGEVLIQQNFSATQVTSSLVIPPGDMAMSVELGDPERVAGFVRPGSEVAVFDTFTLDNSTNHVQVTAMLLPRVPVVAVGPTSLRSASSSPTPANAQSAKPVTVAVLTVAVDARDAVRLAHAAQTGKLYFALLTPQSQTTAAGAVANGNLFS